MEQVCLLCICVCVFAQTFTPEAQCTHINTHAHSPHKHVQHTHTEACGPAWGLLARFSKAWVPELINTALILYSWRVGLSLKTVSVLLLFCYSLFLN